MDIDFSFMEEDEVFDMEPLDERTDLFPVRSVDGVFADPAGNIDLTETRDVEIARQLKAMQESGVFDGKDGYTPIKGVDYFDGKDGKTPVKGKDYFDGKDGNSVTVYNVSESTEDGGSNVVTFSGGKTLTVKNGSTGGKGDPGKTAYEYAKEGGYTGTEEEFKGLMAAVRTEEWVFVLEDGSEIKKKVYAG